MPFHSTAIAGVVIFEPRVFPDPRGLFFESYNRAVFEAAGITCEFVQDNQSHSVRGVLRGLHYQNPPRAQAKLIRVTSGEVLDVAVDIRKGSPTYGQHVRVLLSGENRRQLFVPPGFAHGFVVLSEAAEMLYKCDQYYSRQDEAGVLFNDPVLGIDWGIDPATARLSQRDAALPPLALADNRFTYR